VYKDNWTKITIQEEHPRSYQPFSLSLCFVGRSYCYTVWSAVGSSLLSVRLSVRPSVCLCNAVHCGSQGWCRGLKVIPACS